MQLPGDTASYRKAVKFGRYVTRRLKRAKLDVLTQSAHSATADLKQAGRAWEDAADDIEDTIADRDASDADLDTAAQEFRHALASPSVNAVRERPYTDIFPNGIEYYTAAPLDEEVRRYGELRERIIAHLPETE